MSTGSAPYEGFDSGPHVELPTACGVDADCGPNRFCDPSADVPGCYPCRPEDGGGFADCDGGQVCDSFFIFPFCTPDCRIPGVVCPAANFCEADSGSCLPGCLTNSDCKDAGAVCEASSVCFGCLGDAGCEPGELCSPTNTCQPNCFDAGISCPINSICETSTGVCTPGCVTSSDCGGDTPYCETTLDPPLCAQCLTAAECPPDFPGCTIDPFCPECTRTCGGCQKQSDCPSPLHCGGECYCLATSECAGFPLTPVCVGLSGGNPSSYGGCGCEASDDCATGSLCDRRFGSTTRGSTGQSVGGGLCIPSCTSQDAGYCADQFHSAAPVCNPATGFCVPCLQDSDCTANESQPLQTPSCIPYADGGPFGNGFPFSTGGGRCGCSSTLACDDGWTCENPGDAGQCVPPCTFVGGVDSCANAFDSALVLCDTFNGLCQQCLLDSDCDVAAGDFCNLAGNCVQCDVSSQCPADLPGCRSGFCGFCNSVADCPAGQGFSCKQDAVLGGNHTDSCVLSCTPGDDAGLGSVSDAGPACPAAQPFCVASRSDAGGSWCSECRGEESFPNDCAHGFCCGTFCYAGDFGCP